MSRNQDWISLEDAKTLDRDCCNVVVLNVAWKSQLHPKAPTVSHPECDGTVLALSSKAGLNSHVTICCVAAVDLFTGDQS